MHIRILGIILSSILILSATACGSGSSDPVAEAEYCFDNEDFAAAVDICDQLVANDKFDDLSVRDMCRLSTLMFKIAEIDQDETTMALATKCMLSAINKNPDSIVAFMHDLPVEDIASSVLLRQLSHAINADNSNIPDFDAEPDDSTEVAYFEPID